MKIFKCDDVIKDCPYVYTGETIEEVYDNAAQHGEENHPNEIKEILKKMTQEEFTAYVRSMIKDQ